MKAVPWAWILTSSHVTVAPAVSIPTKIHVTVAPAAWTRRYSRWKADPVVPDDPDRVPAAKVAPGSRILRYPHGKADSVVPDDPDRVPVAMAALAIWNRRFLRARVD